MAAVLENANERSMRLYITGDIYELSSQLPLSLLL